MFLYLRKPEYPLDGLVQGWRRTDRKLDSGFLSGMCSLTAMVPISLGTGHDEEASGAIQGQSIIYFWDDGDTTYHI